MDTLSSRIVAALAQIAPEIEAVQFWILADDGFARCGDLVIPEFEFMEYYGRQRGAQGNPDCWQGSAANA